MTRRFNSDGHFSYFYENIKIIIIYNNESTRKIDKINEINTELIKNSIFIDK